MRQLIRDKRGGLFMAFVIGALLFMIGMLLIPLFQDSIDGSRTSLSCASPGSITDGGKLLCLAIDGILPYLIWMVLSIAGGLVISELG